MRVTQVPNLILNGVNIISLLSPRITSHTGLTQKIITIPSGMWWHFFVSTGVIQKKSLMKSESAKASEFSYFLDEFRYIIPELAGGT